MQTAWNLSDELLDQCISAVRRQECTVEACLAAHPAVQSDLEPLLRLSARLQSAQSLRAPVAARVAIQQRLQALPVMPPPRRSLIPVFLSASGRRQARPRLNLAPLLAALLLVVLLGSSLGIVAASAQSLPGDFLYPVKRAQESLALNFALDEVYRADLRLEFASRRIDEAVTLSQTNRAGAASQSLADYNDLIQSELDFLNHANGLTPSQQAELANRLLAELSRQEASLNTLAQDAPQAVQDTIATALTTSQAAHNQAITIINQGGNPPPSGPGTISTPTPVPSNLPPTRPPAATPLPVAVKPTLPPPPGPGYPPPPSPTPRPTLPVFPPPNSGVIGTLRNTPTRGPVQVLPTLKLPTFPATKPPNIATLATRITPKPVTGLLPTRTATPGPGPRP